MSEFITLLQVSRENLEKIRTNPDILDELLYGEETDFPSLPGFDLETDMWGDEYEFYEAILMEMAKDEGAEPYEYEDLDSIRNSPDFKIVRGTSTIEGLFTEHGVCRLNDEDTTRFLAENMDGEMTEEEEAVFDEAARQMLKEQGILKQLEDLTEDEREALDAELVDDTLETFYKRAAEHSRVVICCFT